jgi:hypothetical protein
MPKLLADGREFAISSDAWDAWKEAAEPFELPDDVLQRVLRVRNRADHSASVQTTAATASVSETKARSAKPSRSERRSQKSDTKRSRVASNLLLPESEYEIPILQALSEAGGRLPTREVVEHVGRVLDGRLTDVDREMMRDAGPPRWQNRVQFARLRLVKAGLMNADSPRGVWEISPAGKKRLEEGKS